MTTKINQKDLKQILDKRNKNTCISVSCKQCSKNFVRTANSNKYCKSCQKKRNYTRKLKGKKICVICKEKYFLKARHSQTCSSICSKALRCKNWARYTHNITFAGIDLKIDIRNHIYSKRTHLEVNK